MRRPSQLILPRHTYLYIFALSILKIMCKFAKLTITHQKVNPALVALSCSNQLQKKQPDDVACILEGRSRNRAISFHYH